MINKFKIFLLFFILIVIFSFSFSINVDANEIDDELPNNSSNKTIYGYALKQPVHFHSLPSKNSTILKSYQYNHRLKYKPYSTNWFVSTVYLNGIAYKGYVHKNDVGDFENSPPVYGIAKNKVNVLQEARKGSKVWKSYKKGIILKYSNHNEDWHIATVKVNNKWEKGYIHRNDVETTITNQVTLSGIGIKSSNKVFSHAAKDAKALKSYQQGKILKYRTFSKNWYEATVYINGKKHIGYIAKSDVENIQESKQTLNGIGIKNPTKVYSLASKSSRSLKSYQTGRILKYRTFAKGWYEATVYISGRAQTGYISENDVEEINTSTPKSLQGIASNEQISVYSLASKGSRVLKNYRFGHHLKFKSFTKNWYQATVYINGKAQTGYIFKNDVQTNLNASLNGYAQKNKTNVHEKTSGNSKVLRSYKKGHLLKFKPYNNQWFMATVIINGKARTGYISTKDVSPHAPNLSAKALINPTNVYSKTSRGSKVLKNYSKGKTLKFRPYSNNWYVATVYINGKPNTGYIHVNDVGDKVAKEETITKQPAGHKIPILMYHQIGDEPEEDKYGLFVTEDNFKEQVNFLKNNGFSPLHFDELDSVDTIKNPIIITFDDGYENNTIAYDILKEAENDSFQSKASFFIIPNKFGDSNYLSEEQVKEMSDSGIISIQSHTMTHVHFNNAVINDTIDFNYQLLESKQILENITGKSVNVLAYPYGSYNDLVIEQTKKHYDYAVTTRSGFADTNKPYELSRVRISFDTSIDEFERLIKN